MVMKPRNAYKRLRVSYIPSMPTICFDHTCDHPRRGALQGVCYKTIPFKTLVSDIHWFKNIRNIVLKISTLTNLMKKKPHIL
jgi:hypothetical protein